MQTPIQIGNFEYTQDEKGDWIYKSKQSLPLSKEKAQYKEEPQYPLQTTIEGLSKTNFAELINKTTFELINYIKGTI